MKTTKHGLSEKEKELVQQLMANCKTTGDVQAELNHYRLSRDSGSVLQLQL